MIAPPKTLAAAAVRPKRTLVRIGFIRGMRDDSSSQHSVLTRGYSPRMSNVHHVAVLHDVVFALETQRTFGAGIRFRAGFQQLFPADGFGADEVFLQIGMDGPGSFLCASMRGNLPGTAFVFAGGEEG